MRSSRTTLSSTRSRPPVSRVVDISASQGHVVPTVVTQHGVFYARRPTRDYSLKAAQSRMESCVLAPLRCEIPRLGYPDASPPLTESGGEVRVPGRSPIPLGGAPPRVCWMTPIGLAVEASGWMVQRRGQDRWTQGARSSRSDVTQGGYHFEIAMRIVVSSQPE